MSGSAKSPSASLRLAKRKQNGLAPLSHSFATTATTRRDGISAYIISAASAAGAMESPTQAEDAAAPAMGKINIRAVSDALEKAAHDVKSPLKNAMRKAKNAGNKKQSSPSSSSLADQDEEMAAAPQDATAAADLPIIPPDEALQSMDIFVDEILPNISVPTYHDKVWADENGAQFYASWLTQCGKMKVLVSDWEEMAGEGGGYVGPIDHEQYTKKRVITFVTKRQGIGPSTAEVTQTHMSRVEGADKCVVAITINMKVPFGDSFSVSVRWVASRLGANNLQIQCGMAVTFHKTCLVESKIRTNTTAETKKGQNNLFLSMKKRLDLKSKPSTTSSSSPKMPAAPSFDEGTTDVVTPYSEEAITQSDDSCWAGICAIFGAKNETKQQEAAATPRGVEDIVLSICGAHHKLGQVHDAVISGCCDPSLARRELKHIHSSLSKITDK